jgi:hypothetical protein
MNQPPFNPYQPPAAPLYEQRGQASPRIVEIARNQKGILLCVLAHVLTLVVQAIMPSELGTIAVAFGLVVAVASAVFVYLLARALFNVAVGMLFALLTFVPWLGLLGLLVLNQMATAALRKEGIAVGLLGADLSKLK